jgi:hypothetical protein
VPDRSQPLDLLFLEREALLVGPTRAEASARVKIFVSSAAHWDREFVGRCLPHALARFALAVDQVMRIRRPAFFAMHNAWLSLHPSFVFRIVTTLLPAALAFE